MATYYSDVVNYLVDFIDNFNGIESQALEDLIYDFLMTRENGYADELVNVWNPDTTSYDIILVDTTSPNITVLQWKELYLEEVYNQALRQNGQAGITDDNSPNYPLVDFRGTIQDFDATTSIDYNISAGEDSTDYIEYEYASPVSIDGVLLQGGLNGVQNYSVIGEWNLLSFYLGYSNNGEDWHYIYRLSGEPNIDATSSDSVEYVAGFTTSQTVAKNAPFLYYQQTPLEDRSISTITFTEKSIESKYWRFFPVDLEPTLIEEGWDAGYTGYIASLSHLRFHQIVEHGNLLVEESVLFKKFEGNLSTAGSALGASVSGAAWFTHAELTITAQEMRQISYHIVDSIIITGSMSYRIQVKNEDGAWETLQSETYGSSGFYVLNHSDVITNPNANIEDLWTFYFRFQDQSVGTPAFSFKISFLDTFRSS